jgi:hypothetical protein
LTTGDDGGPSVAVVNARMAHLFWPGGDALNQCFKIDPPEGTAECTRVVGIAEDSRREGLIEASPSPQYYVPLSQAPKPLAEPVLLVRASRPDAIKAPRSMMQFSVSQRRHEMGVRIALGARSGQIVRMVAGESLRVAALACVTGIGAVLAGGRFVRDLLFQTSPNDPLVLGVVAVVLLVSAVLAALVPAWRAVRVDPVRTLKAE